MLTYHWSIKTLEKARYPQSRKLQHNAAKVLNLSIKPQPRGHLIPKRGKTLAIGISILIPFILTGCLDKESIKSIPYLEKILTLENILEPVDNTFEEPAQKELAEAILKEDTQSIRIALENGAYIDGLGKDGVTPLLYAMENKKMKSFIFLLKEGANPNIETRGGDSIVALATKYEDYIYLFEILENRGDPNTTNPSTKMTPLLYAIENQDRPKTNLLLKNNANIHRQNSRGEDALLLAASTNQYELVYNLLLLGADDKSQDNAGKDLLWRIKHKKEGRTPTTNQWIARVLDTINTQ